MPDDHWRLFRPPRSNSDSDRRDSTSAIRVPALRAAQRSAVRVRKREYAAAMKRLSVTRYGTYAAQRDRDAARDECEVRPLSTAITAFCRPRPVKRSAQCRVADGGLPATPSSVEIENGATSKDVLKSSHTCGVSGATAPALRQRRPGVMCRRVPGVPTRRCTRVRASRTPPVTGCRHAVSAQQRVGR